MGDTEEVGGVWGKSRYFRGDKIYKVCKFDQGEISWGKHSHGKESFRMVIGSGGWGGGTPQRKGQEKGGMRGINVQDGRKSGQGKAGKNTHVAGGPHEQPGKKIPRGVLSDKEKEKKSKKRKRVKRTGTTNKFDGATRKKRRARRNWRLGGL